MCTRLNCIQDNNSVMMYLKLREEGCETQTARRFCSKSICKIDQTQTHIGPAKHKILKIHPNRLLGEKGWQPGFLMKYDLGIGYKDTQDLTEKISISERAILKQYEEYDKKKNAILLQKMLAVKNYADSLKPPNLNIYSQDYLQRIKTITQQLRENQSKPKKYFENDETKFYALTEYVNKLEQKRNSINFKFDPILHQDIKVKTENTKSNNNARTFKRMGTISNIEKEANFIMALQQQTPIHQKTNCDSIENVQQKPEVKTFLQLNHQKIDLAEEFNSTQYLFTPQSSHQKSTSNLNNEDVKKVVSFYIEGQKSSDRPFITIPCFSKSIKQRKLSNKIN